MTLITPVASDPVRNFPLQNESILNDIDELVGPQNVQTYIPVLTASTNPNLGSTGFINGFYFIILEMIFTWGQFRFGGSGISSGSSTYIVSLPFPVASGIRADPDSGDGVILGSGTVYNNSTTSQRQTCTVQLRERDTIQFNTEAEASSSTRAVSGSSGGIPIVWADGDGVEWAARYKRLTQ